MDMHLPATSHPTRLRSIAIALLAVPAVVLLLIAFAEMAGGEPTGVQHVPEAALLLILCGAAWRHPRGVGLVVLATGALLFVAWLLWAVYLREAPADDSPLVMWIGTAIVLFMPPVLAGWLLFSSSQGR